MFSRYMKKQTIKPVYLAPQMTLIFIRTELSLCASTNMSATVEDMEETDYGWEI